MSPQSKYISKLTGATILIIGGTSGLGFGLAEACVENNAGRIILSSSNQHKIDSAISRLGASYPDARTELVGLACDLGNQATFESNIDNLFNKIEGNIDHVVFTAGGLLNSTPIEQLDFQSFVQTGLVRFFAPIFVAKVALKRLSPGPASSITFTSGVGGDKPIPGRPAINAYSAGLHGITRALALDFRPVRVNVISPCATDTELWDTVLGPNSQEKKAAIFKFQGTKVATGQVARVEDVVESYLYVLKDKNVTGTVVRTDGGTLIM